MTTSISSCLNDMLLPSLLVVEEYLICSEGMCETVFVTVTPSTICDIVKSILFKFIDSILVGADEL